MTKIFISYARADDEPFVARGFNVWWDRAAMESRGVTVTQEIRDAIAAAECVLLVVGPGAIASAYVRAEWRFALEACRVVVPVLRLGMPELVPGELAACNDFHLIPDELRNYHCPDFREGKRWTYEESLADLVRILRTPTLPLAKMHSVDALPRHYVARKTDLVRLGEMVLPDTTQPVVVDSQARVTAIFGMAGVGKSALVAAFAQQCTVRRSFCDGIVWLRLGQSTKLLRRMAEVGMAFDDDPGRYRKLDTARVRLSALLEGRNCLLVLDDAWNPRDVEPFLNALGANTDLGC